MDIFKLVYFPGLFFFGLLTYILPGCV